MSQNAWSSSPWLNPAILVRSASFVENSTNRTDDAPALHPQPGPRVSAPSPTCTSKALFQNAVAPSAARASPALAQMPSAARTAGSALLPSRLMTRPSSRGPRRSRRRGVTLGEEWVCRMRPGTWG
ncbi:hypothetical protein BE20_03325 [Sorangium cellulosum]|nr:hypothetical protein BE20_03325 [Sorangium cellulosum]